MSFGCLAKLSAITACSCLIGAAAAQPINDACANATPATVGANLGSLSNAAFEGGTPNTCETESGGGGGVDVYFTFTPAVSGAYLFSLCQDDVFFDTILSIHTGCPTDAGNQVACDDDGCGFFADLSEIASVFLQAGPQQSYIIRVAAWDDGTVGDDFILNITLLTSGACCQLDGMCQVTGSDTCEGQFQGADTTCTPSPCTPPGSCCDTNQCCTINFQSQCAGGVWTQAGVCNPTPCVVPVNDACLGAIALSLGNAATGSNCPANDDQTVSCATTSATMTHKTVWYTFTAPATAAYTVNTCGSSFDTLLAVFSGGCGQLTEIACNDDSTSTGNVACTGGFDAGLNSRILSVILEAGVTYRVLVAAWGTDPDGGLYSVVVSSVNAFGSCCIGTVCSSTDAARCGGMFTAGGAGAPDPCVATTGACCCGSSCSVTTALACAGPNQAFAGAGTVCGPFSFLVPCCRANFNKSAPGPNAPGGVSVQDIFDFLTGYFGNDPCANSNDSAPTGMPPTSISVQDIFDFLTAYFGGC